MRVSTFTKWERFKYIAGLSGATILLLFTRTFPLDLFAVFTALGAAIFMMRTRILRHFAKTPIRQVAYVSLTKPIYDRYTVRVGEDENGNPIMERRSRVVGHERRDPPLKVYVDPCYANFDEYIASKRNPLVMICGLSGMGKSELMTVLLRSLKVPKIVFSFKPNDTHLRLPYPVIDVSRHIPNAFLDADALSIAYAHAFPANLRGIMLSEARTIVKNLARQSKDWNEFRQSLRRLKSKATDIQLEALVLIEQQIESLAVGEGSFSIDLTKDVVLDFSHLDESSKTFYAEIALRQIWSSLTGRLPNIAYGTSMTLRADLRPGKAVQRVAIVIDEVHRLTQLYQMDTRSILDTIMLQVRQFGTLHTATQNYTDIPDNLRQFGTVLALHTNIAKDLEAMSKIDPAYYWIVRELQPFEFVDLAFRIGNDGLVPVFQADPIELPYEHEAEYSEPAGIATPSRPQNEGAKISYDGDIRAALAGESSVASPTSLAAEFAKRYGIDENTAKLHVSKALQDMLNNDELQRSKFEMPPDGRVMVLYFRKGADENESPLHRWMVGKTVEKRKDIIHVASSGEALPDIETSSGYVEIETGLKRRVDDLEGRIRRFSQIKPFVIVVPNRDIAEKYGKLASDRVTVKTLHEFLLDER